MKKEFDGIKEKQQELGAFYTPDSLVKKMYEKLVSNNEANICGPLLDPTCGYGNILLYGLTEKYNYYNKIGITSASEKAFSEVYGIELDSDVLDQCKRNLLEWATQHSIDKSYADKYIRLHFHLGNALNPINYIVSDHDQEEKELDELRKNGLPSGILYRYNKFYKILHEKKFSDSEIIKFVYDWRKSI